MNPKIIYLCAGLIWGFLLAYLFIEVKQDDFSTSSNIAIANTTPTPNPTTRPTYPNQYELEVMSSEYRLENKLSALKHDEILCKIADERVEEIKTDFSHNGFQKYKTSKEPVGYIYVGENLADIPNGSNATLLAWKNSPSHNENLLNANYTSTCVICSETYCVQIFGGK